MIYNGSYSPKELFPEGRSSIKHQSHMFKKATLKTLTLITATCDGLNFKFATSNQRRVCRYLYIFGGTSIRQTRRRVTGSAAEVSVSIKAAKTIPEK